MNTAIRKTTGELIKGDVLIERVTVARTGRSIVNHIEVLVVGELRNGTQNFIVRARLGRGTYGREHQRWYPIRIEHTVECGIPITH